MNTSPPTSLVFPSWEGAAIRNVRGVPGTAACVAITRHDGRLVLITTCHVLFDLSATVRSSVSLVHVDGSLQPIGRSGWGRRDPVRFGDVDVFVDCAVVELFEQDVLPAGLRCEPEAVAEFVHSGARVTKLGAATGFTEGCVVAVDYEAQALIAGRTQAAPRQLLVRSLSSRSFSSRGDSGSLLRDESGAICGLLWGVTARGDGVACPIAPVLWVLHVQPLRFVPSERFSTSRRIP